MFRVGGGVPLLLVEGKLTDKIQKYFMRYECEPMGVFYDV